MRSIAQHHHRLPREITYLLSLEIFGSRLDISKIPDLMLETDPLQVRQWSRWPHDFPYNWDGYASVKSCYVDIWYGYSGRNQNALSVILLTMIALCQPSNTSINNQVDFWGLLLLRFVWVYLVFSFLIVLSASSGLYILICLQQERLSQEMLIHERLIGIVVNTNQKTQFSMLMMVFALNINLSKQIRSGLHKQNGAEHSYRN